MKLVHAPSIKDPIKNHPKPDTMRDKAIEMARQIRNSRSSKNADYIYEQEMKEIENSVLPEVKSNYYRL